eukprot:5895527-Amphidinium_carterae.1
METSHSTEGCSCELATDSDFSSQTHDTLECLAVMRIMVAHGNGNVPNHLWKYRSAEVAIAIAILRMHPASNIKSIKSGLKQCTGQQGAEAERN